MSAPYQPTVRRFQFLPLLINLLITLGIGLSASMFTRPEIKGWYRTLHKPSFTPPPWLFAPVWTAIYILIAIAAYLIWKRRNAGNTYGCAKASYVLQLTFNFLWSFTFFRLHEPLIALAVIVCLLCSIAGTLIYFNRIHRQAAWLFFPYLLWVSYATALNGAIVYLNN